MQVHIELQLTLGLHLLSPFHVLQHPLYDHFLLWLLALALQTQLCRSCTISAYEMMMMRMRAAQAMYYYYFLNLDLHPVRLVLYLQHKNASSEKVNIAKNRYVR